MKAIFIFILTLSFTSAFAGTGTHGGNHLKDRFLLARQFALKTLAAPKCRQGFSDQQCKDMERKLKESGPLKWYTDHECLRAVVQGKNQCVTANTDPGYTTPITVDLNAAMRTKISFKEAVILLIHEGGHAIGLSESLITDEKITQILANDLLGAVETQSDLNEDINWVTENPITVGYCLKLKEALEKIYDGQMEGSTGTRAKGFSLVKQVQDEHRNILTQIWNKLGPKNIQNITSFLETYGALLPDLSAADSNKNAGFMRTLVQSISDIEDSLEERGLLIQARFMPPHDTDVHKHWLEIATKHNKLYFEVCTVHYEDATLVNSTRLEECSRLEFSARKYREPNAPFSITTDYVIFGDGGQYRNVTVEGQEFSLWQFPKREAWALNHVGVACERKILAAKKGQGK